MWLQLLDDNDKPNARRHEIGPSYWLALNANPKYRIAARPSVVNLVTVAQAG
ncbi:hypothetical protein [Variovorax sp. GT1P44]|uniref:hypothetical protein n=1 Tax=Variovorax sp. GT1P44 TaxID=3443742 RepID=UPI003F454E52